MVISMQFLIIIMLTDYSLSTGLLNMVMINPITGLNNTDQKTDFPYPILRFVPINCAIRWASKNPIATTIIQV